MSYVNDIVSRNFVCTGKGSMSVKKKKKPLETNLKNLMLKIGQLLNVESLFF